jgi:hypothetical protein
VIAIAVTTALPMTLPAIEMFIFMQWPSITMMDLPILNSGMVMNFGKHLLKLFWSTQKRYLLLKNFMIQDITKIGATMKWLLKITRKKTLYYTNTQNDKEEPLFTGIKCHEALVLVHEETNQELFWHTAIRLISWITSVGKSIGLW